MTREARNVAASVRQRLLNLARQRGEDFNFLPKPFSLRQLVETVKQVVGR